MKLSQELSGLVLPADVRPPCFENVFYDPYRITYNQLASSNASSVCQSQAVTLQYSLNATVAVEDASTHDMALKQVAMIDPDAMELRFAGDGLRRQSVVPATSMASTEACCCQTLQMQPCPACASQQCGGCRYIFSFLRAPLSFHSRLQVEGARELSRERDQI